MINPMRIEQAHYVVSALNNFLEANKKEFDCYIEDIVSECGFGFYESEPDHISFICGGDIIEVKNISTNDLFTRIAQNGVDMDLIDYLWENE